MTQNELIDILKSLGIEYTMRVGYVYYFFYKNIETVSLSTIRSHEQGKEAEMHISLCCLHGKENKKLYEIERFRE